MTTSNKILLWKDLVTGVLNSVMVHIRNPYHLVKTVTDMNIRGISTRMVFMICAGNFDYIACLQRPHCAQPIAEVYL